MYNPLIDEIESLSSKMIGDQNYKGKPIVRLSDAVDALEELERKLSAYYEAELVKARHVSCIVE